MEEPSQFASLSSLLVRKGGARHAASPLGTPADGAPQDPYYADPAYQAEIVPISRASDAQAADARRQQDRLGTPYGEAPARPARPRRSAFDRGSKAAFTLRLDEERHLRLRLACTAANRSAQQVVTEALDQFLAGLPELEAIAGEMRRKRKIS